MQQENSGFIVVGGLKAGDEWGIDTYSWQVGWKFEGLCRVPLGLHLLVFGSISRQGVFVRMDRDAIIIKDWDGERIENSGGDRVLSGSALEVARRAAVTPGALNLGTYPERHTEVWSSLTSHVSEATLERCGLQLDVAFSCNDDEKWEEDDEVLLSSDEKEREIFFSSQKKHRDEEDLDEIIALLGSPRWTPLPGVKLSSRQDTVAHMDGSERALAMARTACGGRLEQVLAEAQLAFIIFLALGSLEALKQWQRLLSLLCSCDTLLNSGQFTDQLSNSLRSQLELAPSDFFHDPLLSAEDTIRPALGCFFESVPINNNSAQMLFAFVQAKFGLFESASSILEARQGFLLDAPEDAPIIVPPTEETNDPRLELQRPGFPELAQVLDPHTEDADMAAARILDTPHTDPAVRDDATRWLEYSAAQIPVCPLSDRKQFQ